MGKRQFVIPTEKDIQALPSSKFVIPTDKDIELFSQKKNPSQPDMGLSGVENSTDGAQNDDAWYEKLYSGAIGLGKSIVDASPTIAKGLARLSATGFSSGVGAPSMNIMAETRGEKVKYKTKEELLTGASETVEDLVPYTKQKLAKGTSSISEIYSKGYLTKGDAENVGYQLGDGLVQMGVGAIPGVGGVLLYSKNFEQRFEDAKAKGISDDKAYNESAVGALVETVIEKNIGVDKLISKGLSKTLSKEAIKDISGALISKEAFQEVAKKYAKSFSLDNLKQGFVKGFLPEAAEEFAQTYIDGAEQDLFDYYERKRKEDNPNAKLELYDAKDEEGVFNTVNPETGKAELSPSFKSKTLLGALDASFYGGITGQMGGMFVDSQSFNPSIYSTLQNSYDAQGKDGLIKSVETLKQGLTKANQDGKLDVNSYNNALKNVDKIASNVSKFEQNSDINSYSRYLLYDNTERIIPQESAKIARNLAEIMTPLELPTEDQIKNDVDNEEVSPMSFEQAKDVPEPFRNYVSVVENENGEKAIQGNIPNSIVKAYNDNQMAVQEAMNNPLFAVQSLTDNNRLVSIEDLERIGQQGGNVNQDPAQQLNFKAKFEANKKSFNKGLRVINYAKEISKNIVDGNVADAETLRRGYANIFAFNEGDTVFYGNKSAKVLDISPNGQSLKLSGLQDRVSASDENLSLEDAERETPVTPTTETQAEPTQATEPVTTQPVIEQPEEEKITGRTMRDAVDELIPFTYRGETGEIYKQRNGVVVFESPNRVYEFGNINDIGDKSIDEFDIIPQEMEIGDDFSVTIDGKKFTNKSQNPFKAITYDEEGNAVSIKLDNDKGQTRVIKGTRAMLIDAKYKIKQLFNDATRDQLAAAADDAARQAATAPETTGESGQTTTTTEGKPVEQAPSIAQQEYDRRVKEIRAKLAEQESEQATQNRQAVANLAASLYTAGINVEILDSNAIRAKYGKEASQGMFLNNKGVIVINESVLPTEWGKTIIFHEGTHPIINIIRNTEPKLYKQLVAAAKEEAKTNPEVNKILQQIRNTKAYGDEFTRNDELVVELIARVASGKLDLNQVKPSFKQSVIDFINKIAKAMGLNPILKDSDQVALTKLATQISDVLNAGRDIAEIVGSSNVGKFSNNSESQFRDENGNTITVGEAQFRLNNNIEDVDSGLEYTYIKDSEEFKELVDNGSITDNKLLKDFNEGYIFLHQPDAAFTGEIRKNGVTLVQGNGGVFYPIRFHKDGYFWASTETTAMAMAKALNENARLNNGRILMALTLAPSDKLLSSTTMASGAMDLFVSKAFNKSFDVNKTGIKSAIIKAARYTETKIVNGKPKKIGLGDTNTSLASLDINSLRDYVRGLLSPDNSSFADRKTFTMELANQVAKLAKANPAFEQQLGQFLHVGIDNKVFKGKYSSGYKVSKTNIIDGLSYLFSEPMLRKTPETLDEKGGNVYAIIEAIGEPGKDLVKAVDSKGHDSYPKAIQAVDDSVKIKLHILQDRQKWNQVFEDNTTNAIVTKERESSVFPPSTGVSSGSLKLNAQMSDINRETLVAPNGKPSNLNQYQHSAVRTPEFKAWFGDWENDPENASKVVDENGEPMVMYHGTSKDKDFDTFKISDRGAWFSSSAAEASSYASSNDSQKMKYDYESGKYIATNTSSRVIPVFLNIKNLAKQEDVEKNILDEYRKVGSKSYRNAQKYLFSQVKYKNRNAEGFAFDTKEAGAGYNYAQVIVLFDGKSIEQDNGTYKWFGNEFNVKSAIGSKFSPTNPKIQMSDIDRTYSPETTVSDAGMTMQEREDWKKKNKVSQRQVRNPLVQEAAKNLLDGNITLDGYVDVVRSNQPIKPFLQVPKLPTLKEVISALDNGKLGRGGIVGVNRSFNDGDKVATRLDIPAYEDYDTWVVSIHDQLKEGKVLAYGQTAVLKNVQFKTSAKGGIGIAIKNDKNTIARMFGEWTNESPESVHKRAEQLINDHQWVQVGMNPFRHSFFYDKSTGEALLGADEVIQVGSLVLAKNVKRAPFGSQAFVDNFSFKNNAGETIQFSDISRDDKRIQFVRENLNNYSKQEMVDALMGAPFNLTKEKAQDIVAQASYDALAPSLPTDNPDLSIPEGSKLNQKSKVVDEYNEGYDKEKKGLLTKASNFWAEKMKYLALQYDSRFFARRKLDVASTEESLAKARLRTLNGIAYAAGQELSKHYNDIFGNGLEAEGERALNSMIFNLRILQIDKNTEQKYQDEIEKLTLDFSKENRRLPSAIEARSIAMQARKNVPVKMHGKTKNNIPATSQTAQSFLDGLRAELGESEYNMLRARAELFRKVNNAQVIKLRDAGLISNEVADTYKDDFYAYRKTLERLYGEQDNSIIMLSGVTSIKGWASLSKEGAENYLEQDARMLLAESYIGTARAIAKNKLREAIFDENIKVDENGREQSIIDKEGRKVTFIKPAKYLRDKNGDIRSNGKELSVADADEGFVNVPYKKDGVVNYFQMEKEMFEQIEGNNIKWKDAELSGAKSNAYYDTTDFVNRVLTGFATRNNPFFWIGNIPMDLQQQVFFTDIWTQGNPLQSNVYVAGARAIARTIKFTNLFNRNTEFVDNTLAEYIAAGGAMDRMSTMKEQRQRTIELSLYEGDKNKKGEWIKSKFKAFNSKMNEGTEIAMRLAAYDQAKSNLINKFKEDNNGATPSSSDMAKIQEIAAAQSRAYTDFAQRGTQIPNLNIAYLNSAIQASGVALEYISDNPAKFANKASQLVIGKFLGTLAIMALMGDAYDELDEYRKDLYSFMFAFDTKMKDDKGNPIFVTADVKNNPQLVPLLGVSREAAEITMKYLRGDEQKDYTAGGTIDRTIELLNHSLFGIVPNVTSIEALTKSSAQILAKNTLLNAGIKAFFGYDAFRGREIEKAKDADVSPYMRGQDDKSIPYFYKAMAMSMANNTSMNQISPAKMQAVAETFITSPSTTPWVGLLYGALSDVANLIIPAKSQGQKGEYSIADGGNKLLKSLTKKFATYTDAEKAEIRSNDILYKMSREESLKFNDTERKIDIQLKDLYKSDSKNFFTNVDKMAKEEGYWDNDLIMSRIDTRARNIDNAEYDRAFIKSDISNEVKILFHTKGSEGRAKLLKYMFDKDATKARQVIDGMIDYGMSTKEAYDTEDLYLKGIK